MIRLLLLTLALCGLVSPNFGQTSPVKEAPKVLAPNPMGVGRLVDDVALKTVSGREVQLKNLVGPNGLVIALTNTTCPICKKYANTLAKLEESLKNKGIGLLYLNPTSNEKAEAIQAFTAQHKLTAPYVQDGNLAKQLGANTTAEVFLLDSSRTLVYRGAIDDQYGLGYSLDAPKTEYLQSAVSALLAQRKADPAATTAPGCELDLSSAKTPEQKLTYHGQIARIIQTHCIECHRTGGVAPFKLDTYDDVVAQAGMIRKVVEKGTMPPWFAATGPEGQPSHWANDRSVPKADKEALFAWLKSDRLKGDVADAPKPRNFESGWNIGKPDAVYEFNKPIAVKANGTMPYQNVVIDTKLTEDKWVRAVEVRPSAPAVVHHVLVFTVAPGESEKVEDERQGFFAAYVPGQSSFSYPDGFAKKLRKGTRLRFQMHYTPNGTATQDSTRIGVIFADKAPTNEIHVVGIANPRITIPAGADNHPETATLKVPTNATLLAFMPHMHLRGKAFRYEVTLPKEKSRVLLDIPHYDFNWQLYYRLAEPLVLTPGTELKATAWYDNSSKNPANPDPTKEVYWGPQTFDEMMLGYVEYYVPVGTASNLVTARQPIDAQVLFKRLDTNADGKVSKEEYEVFMKTLPRFRSNTDEMKQLFIRLDSDKDGFISLEELRKLPGVK